MELTPEQQVAVDHDGPHLTVVGDAGTGKTTVLVARYRRLARAFPASRILVVARNRAAADRFLGAVLPDLRGGFDALPITTVWGLAYDVVLRSGVAVELVGGAEQRALVRRLLATEDPSRWPRYGRVVRRPAFADEVVRWLGGPSKPVEPEVAEFTGRYRAALNASGLIDGPGLLARAAGLASPGRFDHVLVDDADALPIDGLRLIEGVGGSLVLAGATGGGGVDTTLTTSFRVAPPGTLVCCGHPSAEAEAVAGELLAAHRAGTAWSAMAVLVRDLGRRARSIGRALARHGIPVAAAPALARGEPIVAAILDELRTAPPGAGRPADLAYDVWASRFSGETDDRALDAIVALVDGLASYADRHPQATVADALAAIDEGELTPAPWRVSASASPDGVTITSIRAAAGREWHTVVVAGLVEGELPRSRGDRDEERRLWARATSRAMNTLVAVAAPAPGVLLSRFVESWPVGDLKLPLAPGRAVPARAPTAGAVAVWPDGRLQLSASQLDTYDECPLRYAYQYVARAREESGIHAALGTLVHDVLEQFLDPAAPVVAPDVAAPVVAPDVAAPVVAPDVAAPVVAPDVAAPVVAPDVAAPVVAPDVAAPVVAPNVAASDPEPRTFEGLMAVADSVWTDEIGRYRPQIEEARRDFVAMLTGWWEAEGVNDPRPLAVERKFDIEVGPHRLTGRIDRIDRASSIDDPAGVGVRVLDYKTGKREPGPGEVADDLQLAVYHLAATRDPELAALGPPTQLQLLYLRTMHRFAQPVSDDHVERTEARVLAVADRMLAEDFTPSVDAVCRNCSYHRLCPLQPEGRQL